MRNQKSESGNGESRSQKKTKETKVVAGRCERERYFFARRFPVYGSSGNTQAVRAVDLARFARGKDGMKSEVGGAEGRMDRLGCGKVSTVLMRKCGVGALSRECHRCASVRVSACRDFCVEEGVENHGV